MATKPRPAEGSQNKVPIEQSLIDRVVTGVKYVLNPKSLTEWFGPGQPLPPAAQEQAKGRAFDYGVTVNIRRTPRDGEVIDYSTMRTLADGYDLLRLIIETRKDQLSKMKWSFGLKDKVAKKQKAEERVKRAEEEAKKPPPPPPKVDANGVPEPQKPPVHVPELPKEDPRIEELESFFAFPDQEHDWDTWLRALLEDMLVLDAPTLYPRMTNGGDLYALELVDGSTVKRILDGTGRTPQPPEVAYQQILKGVPAVDYSRDELIYKPRNVRTNKVYGYSPVEQVIMSVNIAIRRQISQLQYYTEGNVPEAIIGVPEDWNPDQIKQFQEYWDSLVEGNTAQRRHAKFVPGGMNYQPTRETQLKDTYDEWLARILCFAFNISPQALVAMMNRATAETAQAQAMQEGLQPLMNWVKNLIDYIVWKYFGYTDLEFKWEEEQDADPKTQMDVLTGYVAAKILTVDEARDEIGRDPMTAEQEAKLNPPAPPDPFGGAVPKPGQPGTPAKPGQPEDGGTGKPVGKTLRAVPLAKALSRNRASAKRTVARLKKAVTSALASAAKQVAGALTEATKAGVTADEKARKLIERLTFEELRDLAPELAEAIEDMAADGGKEALAQILAEVTEDQLKQVNERAVAYAEERSATLVKGLEDSTRDMLRSTVAEGIEEGWSNDKLADALADSYAFSDERAETIARTETAYADVQGNLEGYKASGVVAGKQWIIAQDEFCDDCKDLDGVVVGLDEEFPGDGGDGPPLHPNCRCDILPVLTEEDTE